MTPKFRTEDVCRVTNLVSPLLTCRDLGPLRIIPEPICFHLLEALSFLFVVFGFLYAFVSNIVFFWLLACCCCCFLM